ncbi:MAG: T9SS type A sorting domain-containing protein, partial [Bacteroidales bacterium]
ISGYGIPNFVQALWELKGDETISEEKGFLVYPNPFTSEFELKPQFTEVETEQIDIYTADGKLIYTHKESWQPGERIRITQLKKQAPGVYYIIGKTTEGEIVTKLIKQ